MYKDRGWQRTQHYVKPFLISSLLSPLFLKKLFCDHFFRKPWFGIEVVHSDLTRPHQLLDGLPNAIHSKILILCIFAVTLLL